MTLALLTDLYQLTMGSGYLKAGLAERRACFHLYFRKAPFGGRHAIACGIETVADYLSELRFEGDDLRYLETLTGNDGQPLFDTGFLSYLSELRFSCDVQAVAEGEIVLANTPLLRVVGPLLQCQLIETPLLNMVNFQTLIATKAARVCEAARGEPVLEFGLRRAQGIDGGLSASRAAYVGGCVGTSNVLAGRLFDIPVKGTHAHAWVMVFGDELEAFEAYARAMPNNCVFLVDTYDTLLGVENAVAVGKRLRARGHEMVGIRLDSGDMAALSIEARRILDAGGFPNAAIVASSDLDEHRIRQLKADGATIGVWGVGTRLATAKDQPALGGVYKLAAIQDEHGAWEHRIKISGDAIKTTTPGLHQVRRLPDRDVLWSETLGPPAEPGRDLLRTLFAEGRRVAPEQDIHGARARAMRAWAERGERGLTLEERLGELKARMIEEATA